MKHEDGEVRALMKRADIEVRTPGRAAREVLEQEEAAQLADGPDFRGRAQTRWGEASSPS
eukprot:11370229-Heterocapsa_arctica.AAC.1